MLALHFFRQIELFPPSRYFGVGCVIMWCDPICFSYLFLIFMGLKWFTTSWNQKYSPQMLWEHHFRPIKMDHSQLYRRETITINISERMSEDMPDRMSEDMPDRIPEDMPDRMSEDMPDRMSDRMLEDLADRIPDRMSEDMPDKLYFHLHGSEMVYHILKPETLTTNAMGTSFQTHQDGPFPTTQKRNHHHQQRYQWYVLIPMGIWFGIIPTFQVFWGWMCNYVMWPNMFFLSFPHLHGSENVYHILKPEIFTTNAMGTSFQTHQDGPFPTIQKRNHHHQQRYQWYVLIPMGIWFGFIPTFQVFWGWMCNYVMWPNMFFLSFPHLHGSEMVYHILKPEIFTTNAMGTSFQTHQDGPFPTIQKRNHHHQHIRKNVRRYAR